MAISLLKGLIIGIVCGAPIGAAGAMTIQRTLKYGIKQGLLTGLGSSVADCIFASIGVFGLNFVSDFLTDHSKIIYIVGGCFVSFLGVNILRQHEKEYAQVNGIRVFLSSFTIGITNPFPILAFLIAFSYMNIDVNVGAARGILCVIGVFAGTYFWWALLTTIALIVKKKAKEQVLKKLNVFFGFILITLGIIMIVKGFINK